MTNDSFLAAMERARDVVYHSTLVRMIADDLKERALAPIAACIEAAILEDRKSQEGD